MVTESDPYLRLQEQQIATKNEVGAESIRADWMKVVIGLRRSLP